MALKFLQEKFESMLMKWILLIKGFSLLKGALKNAQRNQESYILIRFPGLKPYTTHESIHKWQTKSDEMNLKNKSNLLT